MQPSAALQSSPQASGVCKLSIVSPTFSSFVPFVLAAGPWYADRMQLPGNVVVVVTVDVVADVVVIVVVGTVVVVNDVRVVRVVAVVDVCVDVTVVDVLDAGQKLHNTGQADLTNPNTQNEASNEVQSPSSGLPLHLPSTMPPTVVVVIVVVVVAVVTVVSLQLLQVTGQVS